MTKIISSSRIRGLKAIGSFWWSGILATPDMESPGNAKLRRRVYSESFAQFKHVFSEPGSPIRKSVNTFIFPVVMSQEKGRRRGKASHMSRRAERKTRDLFGYVFADKLSPCRIRSSTFAAKPSQVGPPFLDAGALYYRVHCSLCPENPITKPPCLRGFG